MKYFRSHILVCNDPECVQKGSMDIMAALEKELSAHGLTGEVEVLDTPRIGSCDLGPEIMVYPEDVHYVKLTEADIPFLVEEQFIKGRTATKFLAPSLTYTDQELSAPTIKEVRVVLSNCGKLILRISRIILLKMDILLWQK